MKNNLAALFVGFLFAVGLGISGMTLPEKVIGFLDFAGDWDPALMFVMGGAVLVYSLLFPLVTRRKEPLFSARFFIPARRDLNPRLIGGAALFGLGWGLGGFCPGPAIVSLPSGAGEVLAFAVSLMVGMLMFRGFDSLLKQAAAPQAQASSQNVQTLTPRSNP